MMIKKITTLSMLVGAATLSLPAVQSADANTVLMQASDPNDLARTRERNGAILLRATNEEHTPEQATFSFAKTPNAAGETHGILVYMGTGALDSEAGPFTVPLPRGRIQGACIPITVKEDLTSDTGLTIVRDLANAKFISDRECDDYRCFHHPLVEAIGGVDATANQGEYFAVQANWDEQGRNNNTETSMQVIDSQCNLQTITSNNLNEVQENNTSVVVMAKNNDNCAGRAAENGEAVLSRMTATNGDIANITTYALCNGNGRDDGWVNSIDVNMAAAPGANGKATFNVAKRYDRSVVAAEERSRGTITKIPKEIAGGDADSIFTCGTSGNSQPQRQGIYCSLVNAVTGERIWRERVAYRGETASGQRTYAMRAKVSPITTLDMATGIETPTGEVVLQYQMRRGNNNNNQKGGYDDTVKVEVFKPTTAGPNRVSAMDMTEYQILAKVEATHASVFQTWGGVAGVSAKPYVTQMTFNHNGNGNVAGNALSLELDATKTGIVDYKVHKMGGPIDGQKYAKYLGNNPNNQGRNYVRCNGAIPVPAAARNNPLSPLYNVPVFGACASTGKLTNVANPAMKPDVYFDLWNNFSQPVAEPTPGDNGGTETPGDNGGTETPGDNGGTETPGDSGDTAGDTGFSSGGCSTGGSKGGALSFLLLGLALIGIRRRRSL